MSWKSCSLQTKIGVVMLPMILPVLGIVTMSYGSGRATSLESSERLADLTVEQFAAQLDSDLAACRNTYLQWTGEDVYGMAVEFRTLQELEGRLQTMMDGSGFSAVVVTDVDGKVVVGAAAKGLPKPEAGKSLELARTTAQCQRGDMQLVGKTALQELSLPFATSLAMHMECKDSGGKPNAHFVAVLDWQRVVGVVEAMANRSAKLGFTDASALLCAAPGGEILVRAGREADEKTLPAADAGQAITFGGVPCMARVAPVTLDGKALPLAMTNVLTEAKVLAASKALLTQNLVLAAVALVLLMTIGFGVGRWIARPIRAAAQQLEKMSHGQGDLTVRLPVRSEDELGALASGFNRFVAGLGDMIVNIRREIEELGGDIASVREASQQSSKRSMAQAESVNQINQSTEEIAVSTNTNAEEARGASEASASAKGATEEGRRAMVNMAKAINEAKDASSRASKIIDVIDGIAFQVNLLALNAAVEAARAGEAGRGFAVVAEEVRSLAQRSASAARDSAAVITECDQRAQTGVQIVTEVEGLLGRIDEQVQRVDASVARIAEASRTQASGLNAVSKNVAQVDEGTSQAAAQAEELASAAEESSGRVDRLKALVQTFRVSESAASATAPTA